MMMMMMMMMMMNCSCGMVDRRKAFSLISSRDHCQRSSPSRISDTPRAGFEPVQNLSSDFVEWNCAVVITTTPLLRCQSWDTYVMIKFLSHFWSKIYKWEGEGVPLRMSWWAFDKKCLMGASILDSRVIKHKKKTKQT